MDKTQRLHTMFYKIITLSLLFLAPIVTASPSLANNTSLQLETLTVQNIEQQTQNHITLSGEELNNIPGSFGDPLKALGAMPGIAIINDQGSAPAIRGSAPGDNNYFIDFLPTGYMFHLGEAVSVLNPDVVSHFNLYPAAFDAEFGDVLGGIIDVQQKQPRTDRTGGHININTALTDVLVETPITQDQGISFSTRRSYLELILPHLGIDNDNFQFIQYPVYMDYQGKYVNYINPDHTLNIIINGARDTLTFNIPEGSDNALKQPETMGIGDIKLGFDSQGIIWQWDTPLGHQNRLALGKLVINNQTSFGDGKLFQGKNTFTQEYLREQWIYSFNETQTLTLGTDYNHWTIELDVNGLNQPCTALDSANLCKDLSLAERLIQKTRLTFDSIIAYATHQWTITSRLKLTTGLRLTHDDYLNISHKDPRLSINWQWLPNTQLFTMWGRHHQLPEGRQLDTVFGNPDLKYRQSDHKVIGINLQIPRGRHNTLTGWQWKTELYQKTFSNLIVADQEKNYINNASGSAQGLEVLIRRNNSSSTLNGWLSLTVSKTERTNLSTQETFPFDYDQPTIATLVLDYKALKPWKFGIKWNFHSGAPNTPIIGTELNPEGQLLPIYGEKNSERLPNYHRLDLRITRTLQFDHHTLDTYLDIINIYNHKNIANYEYNVDYSEKKTVYQLPFFPAIGVKAVF
jgi:outer membrane receptor protein involved in Fe transport